MQPNWLFAHSIITCILYSVGAIVTGWITKIIFSHFYECGGWYLIRFSDRHNWIREPSTSNKTYALLATTIITLAHILCAIAAVYNEYIDHMKFVFWSIADAMPSVGDAFYFFYMTSLLEYHIKAEPLIEIMISTKTIFLIKIITILSFLVNTTSYVLKFIANGQYSFHHVPFDFVCMIILIVLTVFREICLLYLHYSGLNNICHYWYSKHWEEYEKYGDTQRIHEILIVITRSTVTVIVSVSVTFIHLVYVVIFDYLFWKQIESQWDNTWFYGATDSVYAFLKTFDDITYVVSIYFIYDFGQSDYEKLCSKCNDRMYDFFKSRHQKQVEFGLFDGTRYTSSNRAVNYSCCSVKCSCCRIKSNMTYQQPLLDGDEQL